MAEEIKIAIGSASPMKKETEMEVKGRDLVAGIPKTLVATSVIVEISKFWANTECTEIKNTIETNNRNFFISI